MRVLVTGSSGHLGEALVRTCRELKYEVKGIDILASPFTTHTGSITGDVIIKDAMRGVKTIFHTATLHKPHIVTHSPQEFVDTNITGTLKLLQCAIEEGVDSFIFTSTTSIFGDALVPPPGSPTTWITEEVTPIPKNIYGITKAAAENLCRLWHRKNGLPCIILRTSRFFPEEDDNKQMRQSYKDENLKANEFLYRRVEVEDIVSACLLAAKQAKNIGFGTYIISATTPFTRDDLKDLREDAPAVLKRLFPSYEAVYKTLGWKMFPSLDRVYDNSLARKELGWQPKYDFRHILNCLENGKETRSPLAVNIGSKGYHTETFEQGPFPVEEQ